MTNIEEQFYKTFEIEPRKMYIFTKDYEATITSGITDRILLELICILNKFNDDAECCRLLTGNNVEELKKSIFQECFDINPYIKQQVQALFKGEE